MPCRELGVKRVIWLILPTKILAQLENLQLPNCWERRPMVGKMQKITVNNKPVFIFNIGSVIPFEGSSSLNSFSSLEKCMFPSSLIFSLPGAESWGPSENRISPLRKKNQQPATATPRHTCTSCEKFSRSAHVRLTSSCYTSINTFYDCNQQHRKNTFSSFLLLQNLFLEALPCEFYVCFTAEYRCTPAIPPSW